MFIKELKKLKIKLFQAVILKIKKNSKIN